MKNYTQTISAFTSKEAAFYAFTRHVEKWWGTVDHPAHQVGDVFKVSFGEAFWTFKIIQLQKFDRVSWECIEAHQVHEGLEDMGEEWLKTKLHWEILQKDNQAIEIHFVHEGLVPEFACFKVCATGWDFYITERLKSYLENRKASLVGEN